MTKKNNIAVIILNWNGIQDTLECIESVKKSKYNDYSIIVADNGSTDNSINIIKNQHDDILIIDNKENLGFAEGNNRAIEHAINNNFQYVFLLNNDTTIDNKCLTNLMKSYSDIPGDSILGCKICYYDRRETIWNFGSRWDKKKLELKKIAINAPVNSQNKISEVDQIVGCAMLISTKTLIDIGFLEKKYFLNYEETDWCFRAKKNNYQIYSIPDAILYHKISSSFTGTTHSSYFLARNRLLWIKRNFSLSIRLKFYFKIEIPQFIKKTIKFPFRIMILPVLFFYNKKSYHHNLDKIFEYITNTIGITHYHLKKFGNCPKYIIKLSLLRKKLK